MISYYKETLEQVTELLALLNAWEESHPTDAIIIKSPITLMAMDEDYPLGELRDEIGGTWCFIPDDPTTKQ